MPRPLDDDRGSAAVEFVLVGLILTFLTLGVLQLALVVYVRNVLHDAAVDGAYVGARADNEPADGAERTARLIEVALGGGLEPRVDAAVVAGPSGQRVRVSVSATLPLLGFLGVPESLEVAAHAPRESFD